MSSRQSDLERRKLRLVAEIRNVLLDAQVEMGRRDREKELIAGAAYEKVREFVCDRLSKRDLDSVTAAFEEMPAEFREWANRVREIYERAVGDVEPCKARK